MATLVVTNHAKFVRKLLKRNVVTKNHKHETSSPCDNPFSTEHEQPFALAPQINQQKRADISMLLDGHEVLEYWK